MGSVGVREFRDHATKLIGADDGRDWNIRLQSARVSGDPSEHLVHTAARWARESDEARR